MLFLWMTWVLGCDSASPDEVEVEAPDEVEERPADLSSPESIATDAAQSVISTLQQRLQARLQAAMASGGTQSAIGACADEAQGLTVLVAAGTRARVGRASLRLRNPANRPPDWVHDWLEVQGERDFAGVSGVETIVETDQGAVARAIQPIQVNEPCLACHGTAIEPAVEAVLSMRYPQDAATGYSEGDLRGAMWAEVPVQ